MKKLTIKDCSAYFLNLQIEHTKQLLESNNKKVGLIDIYEKKGIKLWSRDQLIADIYYEEVSK